MPNGDEPHGIPPTLREFQELCPYCGYVGITTTTGTWSGKVSRGDNTNHLCPKCEKSTTRVIEERCAMCHRPI